MPTLINSIPPSSAMVAIVSQLRPAGAIPRKVSSPKSLPGQPQAGDDLELGPGVSAKGPVVAVFAFLYHCPERLLEQSGIDQVLFHSGYGEALYLHHGFDAVRLHPLHALLYAFDVKSGMAYVEVALGHDQSRLNIPVADPFGFAGVEQAAWSG